MVSAEEAVKLRKKATTYYKSQVKALSTNKTNEEICSLIHSVDPKQLKASTFIFFKDKKITAEYSQFLANHVTKLQTESILSCKNSVAHLDHWKKTNKIFRE